MSETAIPEGQEQPAPVPQKGSFQRAMESAAGAVSFSRVLLVGLLVVLVSVVGLSFLLSYYSPAEIENSKIVLGYFKDIAMMIVTTMAAVLSNHVKRDEGGDAN